MRVAIAAPREHFRRWHIDAGRRIAAACPGAEVGHVLADGPALPRAVALLLDFERLVGRSAGGRGSDPAVPPTPAPKGAVDLGIGLGTEAPAAARRLTVAYDGTTDETALFDALLAGEAPAVTIVEGNGAVVAHGLASLENAGSTREGYEAVVARAVTLLVKAIRRPEPSRSAAFAGGAVVGAKAVARQSARRLAHSAARQLYRLCCYSPHWRVGWRWTDGRDVWDRGDLSGPSWQVLPDPGSHFYADPFPVTFRGETCLFVEDLDHRHGRGIISAVPFDDRGPAGPARPVLDLPWHLSYPFTLEHADELWMVPESSADRSVRLYRCTRFPDRWTEEAVLLRDVEASDATIVRRDGRWWMFATVREDGGSYSDSLHLFTAPDLLGPWTPHPANPVLVDAGSARPAGAAVVRGGQLWRPVQDCRGGYGTALGLAEVTRLDESGFAQTVRTVLRPDRHWPGRRLHTLNRAGRLECIDGSGHSPKAVAWWKGWAATP